MKEFIINTEYEHGVGSTDIREAETFDKLLKDMCGESWHNVEKMVIELVKPDANP